MIAKLLYLTTPGPDRFVLNFQVFGCEGLQSIEVSKEHLSNVIVDAAQLILRPSINRVSPTQAPESADGSTHDRP